MSSNQEVATALQQSIRLLLRRLRQLGTPQDLTLPETTALLRLDKEGPATSAELARREQISPQSMGATLAGLQRRGLVHRSADPQDGRRVVLALSDAGLAVLRTGRDARTAWLASALETRFCPAELDQLLTACALIERLAEEA